MRVGTQLLVLHRNIDVPGVQRTHSNAGNDGRARFDVAEVYTLKLSSDRKVSV